MHLYLFIFIYWTYWVDDGVVGTDSPNGVASRRIVSVSASYLYDFCLTVGTATRTAGILIHSRLKMLGINLSPPSGWLWLQSGLMGSNNHRWLESFLSSSWVWVDECFVWYRLTQVVPDKGLLNGCVCVTNIFTVQYIYVSLLYRLQYEVQTLLFSELLADMLVL